MNAYHKMEAHQAPSNGLFDDSNDLEERLERLQHEIDSLRQQVRISRPDVAGYRMPQMPAGDKYAQSSMADNGLAQYAGADIPSLQQAFEQQEEKKVKSYFSKKGRGMTPMLGYTAPKDPHSVASIGIGGYVGRDGNASAYALLAQGKNFEHKIAGMSRQYLGSAAPAARAATKLYTILHENFHRSQIQDLEGKMHKHEITANGNIRGYSGEQSMEIDNERHLHQYAKEQAGMYAQGTEQHAMYSAVAHIAYQRMGEVTANYN